VETHCNRRRKVVRSILIWILKFFLYSYIDVLTYAAFTLNGFDDQERNLTFAKTNFQVLKLKFMPAILSRPFYLDLFINDISRDLDNTKGCSLKLVYAASCLNST